MILTPDNEYAAVLDASALVEMRVCELLMRCCEEPALFRLIWAERSLEELHGLLLKSGYLEAQADLRLRKMREAFPEASVFVPKSLLDCCPQIKTDAQRHVFAAAVLEGAHAVVSWQPDRFPVKLAKEYCIDVQTPDEFLVHQVHLNPDRIQDALDAQAVMQRLPRAALIERLADRLPKFRLAVLRH